MISNEPPLPFPKVGLRLIFNKAINEQKVAYKKIEIIVFDKITTSSTILGSRDRVGTPCKRKLDDRPSKSRQHSSLFRNSSHKQALRRTRSKGNKLFCLENNSLPKDRASLDTKSICTFM